MNIYNVTIGQFKKQTFINVYFNKKRHRYWSGKAIDLDITSADDPTLLKAAFELKLREGWRPKSRKKKVKEIPLTVIQALEQGVETKISQGCSSRFIKDAKRIVTLWKRYESEQHLKNLTLDKLQPLHIKNFLVRPNWSAKTQRTSKIYFKSLIN